MTLVVQIKRPPLYFAQPFVLRDSHHSASKAKKRFCCYAVCRGAKLGVSFSCLSPVILCFWGQEDLHKVRLAAHYCQPLGDDRFAEFIVIVEVESGQMNGGFRINGDLVKRNPPPLLLNLFQNIQK